MAKLTSKVPKQPAALTAIALCLTTVLIVALAKVFPSLDNNGSLLAFSASAALFFAVMNFVSTKIHTYLRQYANKSLAQFYLVDKMARLVVSCLFFAATLSVFSEKPNLLASALIFTSYYIIAAALEMQVFIGYERGALKAEND